MGDYSITVLVLVAAAVGCAVVVALNEIRLRWHRVSGVKEPLLKKSPRVFQDPSGFTERGRRIQQLTIWYMVLMVVFAFIAYALQNP
jgi:hypothetical protein